jgi:hypothetical protein
MEDCLRGKGSPRKLRLFACACCRRIEALLSDPRSLRALELAESYADGGTEDETLSAAWRDADRAAEEIEDATEDDGDTRPYYAALTAHWSVIPASDDADLSGLASHGAFYALRSAEPSIEAVVQGRILSDIMGRPPQLTLPQPTWLTSSVIALAEDIYQERAFEWLPILADALQDAGCDREEVLDHCHSPGPHVRGCWVVDLLLGKE